MKIKCKIGAEAYEIKSLEQADFLSMSVEKNGGAISILKGSTEPSVWAEKCSKLGIDTEATDEICSAKGKNFEILYARIK